MDGPKIHTKMLENFMNGIEKWQQTSEIHSLKKELTPTEMQRLASPYDHTHASPGKALWRKWQRLRAERC